MQMRRQLAAAVTSSVVLVGSLGVHADTVQLIYSNGWAKSHVQVGVVADEWIRRVEAATDGRVKMRHVPGGALIKAEATLEGLRKRVADCGAVVPAYTPGQLPISSTLLASIDMELGNKLDVKGITAINNRLFEEFDAFRNEYAQLGVQGLVWVPTAPYAIISRKETTTLADLEGQKLRGFGQTVPKFESAMGAVPVALSVGEMYTSIQTGVIDGALTDPPLMVNARLYEVAKYVLRTGPGLGTALTGASVVYVCNEESWQTIPADDRKIIDGVIADMAGYISDTMETTTREAYDELAAKGATISALTEEDVATLDARMGLFDQAAKELDEKGLPGSEMAARYRELAKAYLSGEWKP